MWYLCTSIVRSAKFFYNCYCRESVHFVNTYFLLKPLNSDHIYWNLIFVFLRRKKRSLKYFRVTPKAVFHLVCFNTAHTMYIIFLTKDDRKPLIYGSGISLYCYEYESAGCCLRYIKWKVDSSKRYKRCVYWPDSSTLVLTSFKVYETIIVVKSHLVIVVWPFTTYVTFIEIKTNERRNLKYFYCFQY